MNPEIKRRWVDKLRSGTIKQIRGRLNDGTGCCPLGVLCEIAADEGIINRRENQFVGTVKYVDGTEENLSGIIEYVDPKTGFGSYNFLPICVARWSGLTTTHGAYLRIGDDSDDLDDHNENGRTFAEIADAIEQQL